MPDIVVPDEGERELLARMLAPTEVDDSPFILHLFTNDYTPHRETTLADFTEVVLAGYASVDLVNADWQTPVTVGGVARCVWGTSFTDFTVSGGSTPVWGYYVSNFAENVCLWAQRFDAVKTLDALTPVSLIPVMRLHGEYEPAP